MSKLVPVKDFELQMVKFAGKKGLEVDYFDLSNPNKLWTVNSDTQPSDDYVNALNQFKEVLAYALGLNNAWDFAREHNRKNEDLLKKAKQGWIDEIDRIKILGIKLVGGEDNRGVQISASLQSDLGTFKIPSSVIIRFNSEVVNPIDETIMVGDLAETAFNIVQEEVWHFVFKEKRGGGQINFPDGNDPETMQISTKNSGLNITKSKLEKVG